MCYTVLVMIKAQDITQFVDFTTAFKKQITEKSFNVGTAHVLPPENILEEIARILFINFIATKRNE